MLLSGCIITKNEDEFLNYSIKSYIDYVDELIVIDDNSTDRTQEIVNSFPKAKLFTGEFNGDKLKQRNEYLKYAQGDWIFCPDGDEIYDKEDLKWLREWIAKEAGEYTTIETKFYQLWKDFIHVIHGSIWDTSLQRVYRNSTRLGYFINHHSVAISDKGFLFDRACSQGTLYRDKKIKVFHCSLCKDSSSIRDKIRYYMKRDNPNCTTPEEIDEFTNRHPYFSSELNQPRWGDNGLVVAGEDKKGKERIERIDVDLPRVLKKHPKYYLYHDYALNMNKYMEEHWQHHNHLDRPDHQKRLRFTAKECIGATLDVGCANGFSTWVLRQEGVKTSGVEPTDWGYKQAVKNYPNIKFYKDYAENLSMGDNSFDTVLLSEIIEHVADPQLILDEAFRVAKKRVVITTPAEYHSDPDHKRVVTPDDFREMYPNCKIKGLTFEGYGVEQKIAEKEEDIHFQIVTVDIG